MATLFEKGQFVEGSFQGRPYSFLTLSDAEEGAGSVYGLAMDLIAKRKVFLKKFVDPSPRAEWFAPFVEYHRKLRDRINASGAAKQLIVNMDFFLNENDRNRFWQVIEYVDNSRNLKSFLVSGGTTWEQRVKIAKILMLAVKALHEEVRLVHSDLKPRNILLIPDKDDFRLKLIEFERPVFLDGEDPPWAATEGYFGTPGYFSPEHVRHQRPTDKSDVFTAGIILYQLLCDLRDKNGHPFAYETISSDYNGNAVPEPKPWGSFGSTEKDVAVAHILRLMLDPDPSKRPSASEVHMVLS